MTDAEVMVAGFGGQGVLLSGKLLALAAMAEGREVSWLPSYGPEMRGGTCNVTVCISDAPIGSPYITRPTHLLVLNRPSLEKYSPAVTPGGLIAINRTLIPIESNRHDCSVLYIDATEIAERLGTIRAANIVMLGLYVGWSGIVGRETCIEVVKHEFERKPKFVPVNVAAFEAGHEQGLEARRSD
jgi:2-oxoglutarate ferredoxin oxidoreductase subunit gamma